MELGGVHVHSNLSQSKFIQVYDNRKKKERDKNKNQENIS